MTTHGKRINSETCSDLRCGLRAGLNGGVFLDPRNSDDRKAVNAYFTQVMVPRIVEATPLEGLDMALQFAERTGMVPDF